MRSYIVLAEKDSLAAAVARAFGRYAKKGAFYEAENPNIGRARIYFTFGHILQTDVKRTLEKAGCDNIPCFPDRFVLTPSQGRAKLFKTIYDELKKGKYDAVIHAGDPDREGELLIREVLNYAQVKKPIYRLWFNSLTKEELYRALTNLKPASDYDKLYSAATARQMADFWIGINGSNALQRKLGSGNHSVGRVQTPVLKLIYDRDKEIENFKPEVYYTLKIKLEKDGTVFWAEHFDPSKKEKQNWLTKELADKYLVIVSKAKTAIVKDVKKEEKQQYPPKLPKLSDMQVEAGRKLKIKANQVLAVIQGLYERGVVSYPRTDSNYLSTNDRQVVERILDRLGRPDLKAKIPNRMFNDKDVAEAGHHAIIPLDKLDQAENRLEKEIYEMIKNRFLAQFYPPYRYEKTTAVFECGGLLFKAEGKREIDKGWKVLYWNSGKTDG